MNFYSVSALINVITSVVFGLLVLSADYRGPVNRRFTAFAIAVAVWSYAYFLWQISVTASDALFWSHALMAGAIFIPATLYDFSVQFLGLAKQKRRSVVMGYGIAIVISLINWTPWFITSVVARLGFPFWPTAGPLYTPFLIIWIGYAGYAVWLLYARLNEPQVSPLEASAIRLILSGMAIGYVCGITNFFLWYNIPVLPVGNISTSIFVAFIAIAIVKYRIFNMRVVAAELLTFLLWLSLFIRVIIANNTQDRVFDGILLVATLVIGVFLIRSVDHEVEQREVIEKQELELEVANNQQEVLLHFISHEIKGYLTKGEAAFASIIEDGGESTPAPIKQLAAAALTEMRKGVATVMNILDASNLKRGTVTYNKVPFNFRTIVEEVVEAQRAAATERGLELDVHIADGEYRMVGDAEKLREHVIDNLIDNAIKYTPSGTVHIDLSDGDGKIHFSVQDSGVGITPDDMSRLFTEGGHGKDSIKVNVHSTGYGLFIAKQVVDAHGGRIWAESAGQGKGSRFSTEFTVQ